MRPFLTCLLIGCTVVCGADTTIKIRSLLTDTDARADGENPQVLRTVYYRRGAMRKKESLGDEARASIVSIANCDTKTGFFIDLDAHEYRTYNVVKFGPTTWMQEYLKKAPEHAVPVESRTVDTGERKTFFGCWLGTL